MADPIQPLTPDQIALQEARASHEGYVHRCLVALDQFANVLADGIPDMTISSRAAIADQRGKTWGKGLSRLLNLFQADHGMKAEIGDEARAKELEAAEKPTLGSA
jgi:hypothetical protein